MYGNEHMFDYILRDKYVTKCNTAEKTILLNMRKKPYKLTLELT